MVQDIDENIVFSEPIIYCHFADGIGEPKYMPIKDWAQLTKLLDEALVNYNELVIIIYMYITYVYYAYNVNSFIKRYYIIKQIYMHFI